MRIKPFAKIYCKRLSNTNFQPNLRQDGGAGGIEDAVMSYPHAFVVIDYIY